MKAHQIYFLALYDGTIAHLCEILLKIWRSYLTICLPCRKMRRPNDFTVTSKYFIFQRKSFWWFFFFETPSCPSTWSSIWRNIEIFLTFLHQRVFLPLPPSLSSTRPSFGAPCSQSLCSSTRPNFINDCGRRPWHKHNYSWCIDPHNQHLGSVPTAIVPMRCYTKQIFKQKKNEGHINPHIFIWVDCIKWIWPVKKECAVVKLTIIY